jgi:hypothetical protein
LKKLPSRRSLSPEVVDRHHVGEEKEGRKGQREGRKGKEGEKKEDERRIRIDRRSEDTNKKTRTNQYILFTHSKVNTPVHLLNTNNTNITTTAPKPLSVTVDLTTKMISSVFAISW